MYFFSTVAVEAEGALPPLPIFSQKVEKMENVKLQELGTTNFTLICDKIYAHWN